MTPRLHDVTMHDVAASITEFGWRQPIVVDEDGMIVSVQSWYQADVKLCRPAKM